MQIRGTCKTVWHPHFTVWHYMYLHADWGKEAIDWAGMLTEDINLSWDRWYQNWWDYGGVHTKESPTITKEFAMAEERHQKCNIWGKETPSSKRLVTVLNSDLLTIESLACFAKLKPTISKIWIWGTREALESTSISSSLQFLYSNMENKPLILTYRKLKTCFESSRLWLWFH